MKEAHSTHIISVGLAIFSMLFGAGNLMYPLMVGMTSGSQSGWGLFGFLITAVLLPLMGLIAMLLFNGNYEEFFGRLGRVPGKLFVLGCITIIGPLVGIPRIVTLSHVMIAPFIPFELLKTINPTSSFVFALLFLGITFLASYRENRIVDILGYVISPILVISLLVIIAKGLWSAHEIVPSGIDPWVAFKKNLIRGYETLDLLAAIFFSSVVLHILKNTIKGMSGYNQSVLAWLGFKAGMLGVSLLATVYIGMGILGMFHGHGMAALNEGELFRGVSFVVLGGSGALIIATAVLMACLSTSIALAAVVAEYSEQALFSNHISYVWSLVIVLITCMPLSIMGLSKVLGLTAGPLVYIGTPILITITLCNIAYKVWGFKPIKLPVLAAFIIALVSYLY